MVLRWPICHHKYEYFTPFIVASIFLNLFLYNTLESLLHSFSWNWENISSNQKEKYENSSLFCIRCLVFSTPTSSSVKLWEVATTACGDSTNTNQDYALPMLSRWQSSLLFIISEDLKIDFLLISICNDLKFALSFE